MYFQAGSFQHGSNLVNVRYAARPNRNARGFTATVTKTLELTGTLIASTQAAIRTAIQNLEAAYTFGTSIGSAGLYHDDGTVSPHFLSVSGALGGVRVESLDFPRDERTGEYATGRRFTIGLSAIYAASNVAYQEYVEEIEVQGTGGPIVGATVTLKGPPKKQILAQRSIVTARQSGRAVGLRAYPPYAAPLWPNDEQLDKRTQKKGSPRNEGGTFLDWPISWAYQFLSVGPLGGEPHRV